METSADFEQQGYDAFVEHLARGMDPAAISVHVFDKAIKQAGLAVGTDERRSFVRGWLKACNEV